MLNPRWDICFEHGKFEEIMCPFCAQEKSKIKNLDESMEKIKHGKIKHRKIKPIPKDASDLQTSGERG
jgi:hypothetical protein